MSARLREKSQQEGTSAHQAPRSAPSVDPFTQFFAAQNAWWPQPFMPTNFVPPKLEVPEGLSRLVDPKSLESIQQEYVNELSKLWSARVAGATPVEQPEPKSTDRRFSAPAWRDGGIYEFLSKFYLINARALMRLAEAVQADAKTRQRIRFAVGQWVDAMSPANFLATNPEAQKKIIETQGESLKAGIANLLHDLQKGRISMTDESRFEVGENVATSEGAVVFENDFFQLIQYKPLTAKVGARPLLIVPPCINKYYILDLQPSNSLVRYAVEQGFTTFIVSWRNPTAECAHWTWDDYVEQGIVRAIEVVREIGEAATKADKINVLGFCVGGTLLVTGMTLLAQRGEQPVASLTLLTTLLDFDNTGVLDVFIDEPQVRMREETIGQGGLMPGRDLAATFSSLRPNDLVWPYVVGNYLKGEKPPAFDLLYWNADSTNLPGPMYAWYLRNTYLENKLKTPGACVVSGKKIDLSLIDVPVYIYGSREDHIVPWEGAYASVHVLTHMDRAKSCFVLGASGHIAGVINPANSGRRNYWAAKSAANKSRAKASNPFPPTPAEWFDNAESVNGSWWPHWSAWLQQFKGADAKAPAQYGGAGHQQIEPAPGRYVKVRVV